MKVETETERKRKPNFPINEKTESMRKNINTIQPKLSNNITNKQKKKKKKQIWEEITKDVNAVGKANRSVQEVKDKWGNLQIDTKTKTKRKQQELCNLLKRWLPSLTPALALDEIFFLAITLLT